MPRDVEMRENVKQALQSFHLYSTTCSGSTRTRVRRFCRDRPSQAGALVAFFDTAHSGFNHLSTRTLTSRESKALFAVEMARAARGSLDRWHMWARHHKLLLACMVFVLFLPMLLSPSHPIAAYGYLASAIAAPPPPADTGLKVFLISPTQVERYRAELVEDLMDARSGKLFAVVRSRDGALRQEPIRTWNSFLPVTLPVALRSWSDRKEISYLGDKVDLWLRDSAIVAMGHYHPYGGGPSPGDTMAQQYSWVPEVIISNGVVPLVYFQGELLPYGDVAEVTKEVFNCLRALETNLIFRTNGIYTLEYESSPFLRSFLAFLRDYRHVDIQKKESVAREIRRLCEEFKESSRPAFMDGFIPERYEGDLDRERLLRNLVVVQLWTLTVLEMKPRVPAPDVGVLPARAWNTKSIRGGAWGSIPPPTTPREIPAEVLFAKARSGPMRCPYYAQSRDRPLGVSCGRWIARVSREC